MSRIIAFIKNSQHDFSFFFQCIVLNFNVSMSPILFVMNKERKRKKGRASHLVTNHFKKIDDIEVL